ncbi:SUKH-4 family immunity protein [Streptomyces shenzhenensis]|uniref:SUKH-4 family immunity protein n=1 Tax=Streptomyces shenzhenensis TaxID=943815 RepID=UPI003D94CFEC
MVTFAQAQERAEEWINGDVPGYQHREVRVREFELGFVVWGEDRAEGPRSDAGGQRLVIARDSGEATLWPALPVGEVIRRYEEEYGRAASLAEAPPAPAARVDLNQTSFLLSPPEWLQEAADKLGIADRRAAGGDALPETQAGVPAGPPAPEAPSGAGSGAGPAWPAAGGGGDGGAVPVSPGAPVGATPWAGTDTNADAGDDRSVPLPATVFSPPLGDSDDDAAAPPAVAPHAETALMAGGSQLPRTAVTPAVGDPNAPGAQGGTPPVPSPQGSVAPPPPGAFGSPTAGHPQGPAAPGTPPPPPGVPQGSAPPPPGVPPYGYPQGSGAAAAGPGAAPPADAGDIADAATSKAAPPPRRGGGVGVPPPPPPPGAPGTPGVRPGSTPPPAVPGTPPGGYVRTQLVSSLGPDGPGGSGSGAPGAPGAPNPPGGPNPPGAPGDTPPGSVHHAATVLADPNRMAGGTGGGAPQPPGVPGVPGAPPVPGVPQSPPVHHAETVLAGPPVGGPGVPPPPPQGAPGMPPGAPGAPNPPGAPPVPGAPQPSPVHHAETVLAGPPVGGPGVPPPPPQGAPGMPPGAPQPMPPGYGYPQQAQPTVGPGYQAVLRYRAQDGSEQQLIRRSAPGTPHPEWQIFHELRAMNVPPDQVLELHTELESCELPGAYCARMIREQWPQARITSIAPYGTDRASRQQGMQQLLAHQGELHQVADGPARPAPVRAPLPPVQAAPPVPPEGVAQELAAAFGPGVFHFEQAAVSRQGVPPIVAHTLVVAGLPVDLGPFFWAQAQPGRPVPTLAELAQERGVQPASDAGSYLVMGTDFGRAVCVQYGTANIVAVPVEAGPGGAPVPPQFVNTGLLEFARCLALLGRMWRLRYGLNQEQAGRWTVDFQAQLASLDPAALGSPESWWSVLLEQMWDGLL